MRAAITVLCLVATTLALYNVYGDNSDVTRLAESSACGGGGCVRTLRAARTPLSQDFTFQTSLTPPATQSVHCQRSYWLVGTFACSVDP